MPLSLSDAEYTAVQAAAAPVHPLQRGAFLQALAKELEPYSEIGPGLVHRLCADLQKRYGVTPHSETSHTAERHRARQAAADGDETRGFHRTGCQFPCWYPWASKPT
jgi:hypothetical protein